MCTREIAYGGLVLALSLASPAASSAGPNLGKTVSAADIAAWDTSIMPDGTGLPAGSGTSKQGALVYAAKCAACHGADGKGGISSALLPGGAIASINAAEKTIANFWPYAT